MLYADEVAALLAEAVVPLVVVQSAELAEAQWKLLAARIPTAAGAAVPAAAPILG